jgi:hypothetical protein
MYGWWWGSRYCAGRVAELPLCLAAITTVLGVVSALQLLEQKLCVLGLSWLFSLCVFPSLSTGSFASKEERAEVSGTHVLTEIWCTTCVGVCSFAQLQPTVTSFTCCGCSRSSAKFLCGTDVIAVVRGPQFLSFFLQRDQDCKTGTEFIGRQLAKKKFI